MDDKLKKLIALLELKNEEKFSGFSKSIKTLDEQDILLSNDIKLLFDEIRNIENSIDDTELKNEIESIKLSIENIQLQKGDNGEDGKDGRDGIDGKDGLNGRDGKDGTDGKNGKDGVDGKDGSPDTPEQIVEKINTLENVIDIKTIKDFPVIESTSEIKRQLDTVGNQVLRLLSKPATNTTSVDLSGYVPYTGATQDLNLGHNDLIVKADDDEFAIKVQDLSGNDHVTLGHGQNGDGFIQVYKNDDTVGVTIEGGDVNAKTLTLPGTTSQYIRGDGTPATFPTLVSSFTNDAGYITSSALSGYVPNTRTLTINGTAYDLSADRSWTIATPTASTGLTNTSGTWTSNLSTGISGGQSVIGGTASGNNLTLSSTSNATKGKILFGTSAYDEVNNRLGIGTTTPGNLLSIVGNSSTPGGVAFNVKNSNVSGDTRFSLSSSNNRTLSVQVTGDSYGANPKGAAIFTDGGMSNLIFMTDGDMWSGGSGYIVFATGGYSLITQERMRITSTGNIGIGTTIPNWKLHVAGTVGADNIIAQFGDANKGVNIKTLANGTGLITSWSYAPADPSAIAISAGANFGFNAAPNNFYGMGLGAARNGKYDMWFQTGTANGGGYRWYTGGTNERMTINKDGNVGIGTTTPTALLMLAAGTATAGSAPLKLTAGTNLTTPENGAFEFDGTNLYFTVGGVRKTVTLV